MGGGSASDGASTVCNATNIEHIHTIAGHHRVCSGRSELASARAAMADVIDLCDDAPPPPAAPAAAAAAAKRSPATPALDIVDLADGPVVPGGGGASGAAAAKLPGGGASGGTVDLSSDSPIFIDLDGCIDLTDDDDGSDAKLSEALGDSFNQVYAGGDVVLVGEAKSERSRDVCAQLRKDVHSFLERAAGQLEVESLEPNPASMPGQPLYERFKAAHDQVLDKAIKLVFHGTPEKNVEAIQRDGLDPKRRKGQVYGKGEYFGTDAQTSLGYTQGGKCMLIFAVLTDSSGVTHHQENGQVMQTTAGAPVQNGTGPGMIVVNKVDHQLPIFVLRFKVKRSQQSYRPIARYRAPKRKAVKKKAVKRKAAPPPPKPKVDWSAEETAKLVEATRKAVLERRKKKKEAAKEQERSLHAAMSGGT